SEKIKNIEERIKQKFINANIEYNIEEEKKNTIKLVFTGQYSAGKSSIIRMLTGREDITVGAGITTQKAHIYEWNGLEIVDTPGIHTQLRPDHDEISYDAIASADMLVFVVTNELFDSHLAQHFRKLAIDKDKAGEMILVVNKMERSSEGNTLVQQSVIREDLRKVIEPYTPEELNLCFLDAESYLDSLEERDEDIELANELFSRSGYTDFIETLNYFVKKKSL
ncbi:GTPase, partial [Clostridium perfringens]